jgi:hypothetical protein
MTLALVQIALTALAGAGIFLLWRRVASASRPIYWLVTAGVLIRALGGQLAFWISYAGLPVGRSMQMGRGFWFFAPDAIQYFDSAASAASSGPLAILHIPRLAASVFFQQTLATALLLFGIVAGVAILLNLAAYLGCCLMVLSFGRPANDRTVIAAIAALSLMPSAIVWSLQPLKDTLFLFFVALFFAAARMWQQLWTEPVTARNAARGVLWTTALAAIVYGISGIRWYFGMVIVLAAPLFALLAIVRARTRLAALVASVLLVPLFGIAFFTGAGPYVPPGIQRAVLGEKPRKQIPHLLLATLDESRQGFDRAAGASLIGAGSAIRKVDDKLGAQETLAIALRPKDDEVKFARERARLAELARERAAAKARAEREAKRRAAAEKAKAEPAPERKPEPVKTAEVTTPPPAQPAVTMTGEPQQQPAPHPAAAAAVHPHPQAPAPVHPRPAETPAAPKPADATKVAKPAAVTTTAAETPQPKPAVTTPPPPVKPEEKSVKPATDIAAAKPRATATKHAHAAKKPEPKKTAEPQPQTASAPAPPPVVQSAKTAPPPPAVAKEAPATSPVEGGTTSGLILLPTSPIARILTGTAAVVLPRTVAQKLGILQVGGGGGMWVFVELDTIAFDLVLVFSLLSIFGALRHRALKAPVFWMMLLITAAIGGALAYSVSNFGTLFRHRDMLVLSLAFLPLAAMSSASSAEPAEAADVAEAAT